MADDCGFSQSDFQIKNSLDESLLRCRAKALNWIEVSWQFELVLPSFKFALFFFQSNFLIALEILIPIFWITEKKIRLKKKNNLLKIVEQKNVLKENYKKYRKQIWTW